MDMKIDSHIPNSIYRNGAKRNFNKLLFEILIPKFKSTRMVGGEVQRRRITTPCRERW
jgi:hypothetical protein